VDFLVEVDEKSGKVTHTSKKSVDFADGKISANEISYIIKKCPNS